MKLKFISKKMEGNILYCTGILNNKEFAVTKTIHAYNFIGYDIVKGNLTREELDYIYNKI